VFKYITDFLPKKHRFRRQHIATTVASTTISMNQFTSSKITVDKSASNNMQSVEQQQQEQWHRAIAPEINSAAAQNESVYIHSAYSGDSYRATQGQSSGPSQQDDFNDTALPAYPLRQQDRGFGEIKQGGISTPFSVMGPQVNELETQTEQYSPGHHSTSDALHVSLLAS
jgi:hypothetical protein